MSATPETLLDLARSVQTHLLPILQESLALCVERHRLAQGRGADNFSFYTDAWSFPARRFKDSAAERRVPFRLHGFRGCVLSLGRYRVRHHCVGWSEQDDVRVSFPRKAGAMSHEIQVREQMLLDFGEDFPALAEPGTLVLGYMANPDDGLCAVYLASPRQVENGHIVGWDEVVELWRRDSLLPLEPALVYRYRDEKVVRLPTRRGQHPAHAPGAARPHSL